MGGLVGRKRALAMRRVDNCECLLSSKCDDLQDERSGSASHCQFPACGKFLLISTEVG